MKRALFLIFLVQLLTKLIFVNVTGINNNYEFQCDSYWLVKLADGVANGNFDFDIGRFIASPLFPVVCGAFKILSPVNWPFFIGLLQIILLSVSGLYVFRITLILFANEKLALLSSLLYALFPLTMWYVNTYSQETLFQSFLIMSIYYLLAAGKSKRLSDTIAGAIFFSLAYLTKSHILIFSVFIPLIYFHSMRLKKETIKHVILFGSIAILFSIPYGLYQYRHNGVFVLSSNGAGYQFYLGNTEAGYKTIVDIPDKNSPDFKRMQDITKFAGYFNGTPKKYEALIAARQNIKQQIFYDDAVDWIISHPAKFINLKIYDTFFFLMPGVSFRHYAFTMWVLSFILSLPVYLIAYIAIFRLNRFHFREHCWIVYLLLSMLIFSTFWYVQNRFRTITLEPFYIIYASYYINKILLHTEAGRMILYFLDYMFLKFPRSVLIKQELKALLHFH